MSFTYAPGSVTTALAKVRMAIGDTNQAAVGSAVGVKPDGANFSDEELAVYLALVGATATETTNDRWLRAVPLVLVSLANLWALEGSHTTGKISEDHKGKAAELRAQAAEWTARLAGVNPEHVAFYETNADGTTVRFPFGDQMFGANAPDQARHR